jgi:hypothetical protein
MKIGWTSKRDRRSEKSGGDKNVKGRKDEDTKEKWMGVTQRRLVSLLAA